MSERDKLAAWALAIAAFIGLLLWLGTQPPRYGANPPCVMQGHDEVCY